MILFTAASFEFDGRLGVVRDRIAEIVREWIGAITRSVEGTQKAGHLDARLRREAPAPSKFTQSLFSAHWAHQLLEDKRAYTRARLMALEKLRSVALHCQLGFPNFILSLSVSGRQEQLPRSCVDIFSQCNCRRASGTPPAGFVISSFQASHLFSHQYLSGSGALLLLPGKLMPIFAALDSPGPFSMQPMTVSVMVSTPSYCVFQMGMLSRI